MFYQKNRRLNLLYFFLYEIVWIYRQPCQELRNGAAAEDLGSVAIGNTVDVWLDIFVGDDGYEFLEGVSVSVAIQAITLQILDVSIARQDFSQDSFLNFVSVFCDIFNELKSLLVFLCKVIFFGFQRVRWSFRHGFSLWSFKRETERKRWPFSVWKRVREREREEEDGR